MINYQSIGKPTPRADGPEIVTGKTQYTADVVLPGTLWGKALRCPYPHARIVNVDTRRAQTSPGVHAVLTGADVRGILYGRRLYDVPILAGDRALFAGERVAAVAAVDLDAANEALSLIDVEYEELTAVFDTLESMSADAPILHPEVNSYVGLPKPLEMPTNIFSRDTWSKGDIDEGFAQSEVIIENTFTTPIVHQAYLETHSCLVWIDPQDRVQVWTSSKVPYAVRQQLAHALSLPLESILLNPIHIGGDFGGKGSAMDIPLAYFLAIRTGRPVKMVMDYIEEFMAGNPRHAAVIQLKTGLKRDGSIMAHQARVIFNSGAYGGFKPTVGVNLGGASKAAGPYKVPNVLIEGLQVYTNTVPGGFMRAPGEPQATFAIESHIDCIARQLEMDPLEFRLRNLIQDGDLNAIGISYRDIRGVKTLEAAQEAGRYQEPKAPNVGRGIAIGERAPAGGQSHVEVTLKADGSITVHSSIFEPGTGTYTILSQVVGEELGLPPERIKVEVWDTDGVSFDTGVGGSRVTRIATQAAYQAATEARQEMLRVASDILGWPEENMSFTGDDVVQTTSGKKRRWAELVAVWGRPITAKVENLDQRPSPVTSFTGQVAEVSVDPETGEVKLLGITTAHDVGRIMNPVDHQGQIDGSVIQGVGYALGEELRLEDGKVTSLSFGENKIPNIKDIPEMKTVLLESESGLGNYNLRGIGENPISPVAPAIANAVENAVGVRIYDLPITSEKVFQALQEKKKLAS